jgi:glucose-6-phosphate dehydrogenase assembly protein OpcA
MADATSGMATAASDAFLSGQGVAVPVERVEEELARLWGPAAERADGPDLEHPAVTRISLANLVVGALGDDVGRVERALETVASRYPCRVIVLRGTADGGRSVSAEISAQCYLPAPGQPQVCSERIVLGAGPEGLDLLPGAVRPLLESDLPMVVWWAGDPRPHAGVFHDLADEATRLIADLADPDAEPAAVAEALDPGRSGCGFGRDLAWFGVHRWRELVAQFFDVPEPRAALGRIVSVEVRVAAPSASRPARVGCWIAAWLAGQVGWRGATRAVEGGQLEATFEGPGGPVAVRVRTEAESGLEVAQIRQVSLALGPDASAPERGAETYGLVRLVGTPEVRVEVCSEVRCSLARLIHAREFDVARRVAAALESRRSDPPYFAALPHLLWMIGA